MTTQQTPETPEERKLHVTTDLALRKYREDCQPAWDKLQRALRAAWRQYDREVAPFEKACDRKIARANRAYTRATQGSEEQR
jgi:hypothetical protein